MFSITKKAFLIFTVYILFIGSCKTYDEVQNRNAPTPDLTQHANADNAANLAKDNTEELSEIIKFPFAPDEETTLWRETVSGDKNSDNQIPAPADKKLVAVIKFPAEDTIKLVELAAQHQTPQPVEIATETWFPPELIAAGGISGNSMLKGTAYSAVDFIKPPYTQGRLIKIENSDFFVLELLSS